ncbi:Benzoyl-CoA reductase/2-hydroxyglutaryl-CoA dehydratase subunit, BcrC/BadD/HgdB [Desulfatibacillum alkenivorans DSM 16219]|jgi:benzoyl-CoA reductase/2-hydroxyglutaryl-CoA dehydratase subunit BcrC/BadD/HgdB|uniref:Benzoyl-CoA reductase/2-hydroxyglutaryl-CoA dehydratase subunit, BcrC/BadD/HgdB n=1 Tax=Desulfatibacillum alkenivorans DSM 16219 TaxID=1121393 RepID=A0A1M6FEU3_9BACT|nr:2-hydroxyacyl-CoA dehydratase family protein [Desulfatibacillum alkenivorans]SHI96244.1 Benzoyl-CoA reductase/2-hydroxyglutaryl-CoA dehydratase subunit, BcrC/BadD/HgdB [Desulfatibacillum alkenivorans DSM 16219]
MSDTLDIIKKLAEKDVNEYITQAADEGRKILGYMCSFVPEEIIHAAGMVPYRLRAVGSKETRLGDTYYSAINCSLVRHIFDKALNSEFAFLNGVVFMNGCDHARRMYDNWRNAFQTQGLGPEFLHMFVAPHTTSETSFQRFLDELRDFSDVLEKHFNAALTTEALQNSIAIYNQRRELLRGLNEMRKLPEPPIFGAEMLAVQSAMTSIPVENAVDLLEQLTIELQNRRIDGEGKLRIVLAGGAMEEIEHIQMIESCGAIAVADNLCTGGRRADVSVEEYGDPIAAVAKRYLYEVSCPRMIDEFDKRSASLEKIMKDYRTDALITEKLMFCDLWGGENFLLKQESKRLGFPMLSLEREMYGGGEGQMRTRVQAFFEMVRNRQS